MASYSKGDETRRRFILSAYDHLVAQDHHDLTVRSLAEENGVSVAALYKHFDNINYLLDIASIRFLQDYLDGYAALLDGSKNPLEIYIEGWILFIDQAFNMPETFYRLFWKIDSETLEHAFISYYRAFPPTDPDVLAAQFSALITNDKAFERDMKLLFPIRNNGLITYENAEFLSASNELIVSGLLCHATTADEKRVTELKERCLKMVMHNIELCIPSVNLNEYHA